MRKITAAAVLTLLVVLVGGQSALATANHPDVFGTNFSFTDIRETSTGTTPEPIWGAPAGGGNSLFFLPSAFEASASGVNGGEEVHSQLQLDITSINPGAFIESLILTEFGDIGIFGPANSTGVYAQMSGFITVLEINGVAVTVTPAHVINFNAGANLNASFNPAALGVYYSVGGSTNWSGDGLIDVAAAFANVTKVAVSWNNRLGVYTELAPNSASIQKKVTLTVVPEPGTFALLCGGLLALSIRARSRRG